LIEVKCSLLPMNLPAVLRYSTATDLAKFWGNVGTFSNSINEIQWI